MVTQRALRPYATAGVALVGASMIAVTPMVAPLPGVQTRSVRLVDAISDLIADTTANYQNILNGADMQAISQVLSQLVTNPSGVLGALSDLTPTVTSDLTSLPGTISVQLPPGLELAIAELGSTATTFNALSSVLPELQTNPTEALAAVLNGYLNGQDNISLLGGTINIAGFNGVLAPLQDVSVNLNLTSLIDALGLGNTSLSNLDLSSLLSQLGLGDLNLGSLFSDLGLSDKGLGTLLADATNPVTTLSGLLNLLGLNGLGSGDGVTLGLTNILSGLGLDTNVNLNSLSLDTVLGAFGLNSPISLLNESLGTLLSNTGILGPLVTSLNSTLSGILNPLFGAIPGLSAILAGLHINLSSLLTVSDLQGDLTGTVGSLLGIQGGGTTVSDLLSALGIANPGNLSLGTVLGDLGFSSSTGDLTLGGLLSDLGNPFGLLNITDLLNGLNLGNLLSDLNLSNLPIDLSNLGDISQLTLGGLLGDLGLGNIADISVQPIGGLATELVDVVPQQILAALGM